MDYKIVKINNVKVTPYWNSANKIKKPVKPQHAIISDEPFLNIICCGRKKSGKTTTCLYMLKHFMTNKTKLVIFSPDLKNDKDNKKAIDLFKKKFGEDSVVMYRKFIASDGTDNLQDEIDEAEERNLEESTSKYEYPKTIFYFDDLNLADLKSKKLGDFAQLHRHYGCICIYSSQDWINFEHRIRKNCDLLLLWNGIGLERLHDIYNTVQVGSDKHDFVNAYKKAFSKRALKEEEESSNESSSDSEEAPPTTSRNFFLVDVVNKEFRRNFDSKYEPK